MGVRWLLALALIGTFLSPVWAHGSSPHPSTRRARVSDAERRAFVAAKPALERHCFGCHFSRGAKAERKTLQHLSFDRYPPTGHHAGEAGAAVRRVLTGDGKEGPTMPDDDPGVVQGDDLAAILAWADAFEAARSKVPPRKMLKP